MELVSARLACQYRCPRPCVAALAVSAEFGLSACRHWCQFFSKALCWQICGQATGFCYYNLLVRKQEGVNLLLFLPLLSNTLQTDSAVLAEL